MLRKLALSALLVISTVAAASMDYYMPFSDLRWENGRPGEKFHAIVLATQDQNGMTALSVSAFGRQYIASNDQLEVFRGFRANGITVTGGPTGAGPNERYITIELSHRWTEDKPQKARYILVHENGAFNVGSTHDEVIKW